MVNRAGWGALLVLLLCLAAPVRAQEHAPVDEAPTRRSVLAAAALEYVVPTLGHAYAGDWERGVPPALVFAGGAGLALAGIPPCADESGCTLVIAGAAIATAGKLWGVFRAAETARRRNSRVLTGVEPTITTSEGAVAVGLSFRL